jgi:predicted transcriptional regulator of viral defense system
MSVFLVNLLPEMKTKAELLLSTSQTVFTVDDLAILWQIPDRFRLWEVIKYYVRTNRLYRIQRGVYALSENYSLFEAAIKLFPPSYISFTTALAQHGVMYQYSSKVHVMAQASKRLKISNGQIIVYHQLKNDILLNKKGVEKIDGYWIASLERAICDTSYLVPNFSFEHWGNADPNYLNDIAKLYGKALQRRIMRIATLIRDEG